MTVDNETPDIVFQRINRRRLDLSRALGGDPAPARPAPGAPPAQTSAPLDEVIFESPPAASPEGRGPRQHGLSGSRDAVTDSDTFPRSATMRLILKHPALALGVGIPAAGLLMVSPASRRLFAVALRVATRPELQQLMLLSALADERGTLRRAAMDDDLPSDPSLR